MKTTSALISTFLGVSALLISGCDPAGRMAAEPAAKLAQPVLADSPLVLAPDAIVVSPDGKLAYVAEEEAGRVLMLTPAEGTVTGVLAVPEHPTGVTLSADGKTLYVTAGCPDGVVAVIDTATKRLTGSIEAGHSPTAPILTPDGKTLFVCDRFRNEILAINLAEGKIAATIPVEREPVAAAVTADGTKLVVANLLPAGPSNGDFTAAAVTLIDARNHKTIKTIPLVNGSIELRGVAISPDGRYAFVTETLARYQVPTTQIERGWICTNAIAIIDLQKDTLHATVLLDDPELGAANPWPIAITPDGQTICIAHAGTHELSVIAMAPLLAKVEKRMKELADTSPGSVRPASPETDLSFIQGLRVRRQLPVNGPRSLALAGRQVIIAGYYSDSIAFVDLDKPAESPRHLILGNPLEKYPQARRGERYFHDANYCFQKWLSCASCHPEGRVDALNWDLLNDGMGNPKNTRTMLYSYFTPPSMSLGIRENAPIAIRAGMNKIQFHKLDDSDAAEIYPAIETYFREMKPVVSPWRTRSGDLTANAKRGETIFRKAGCPVCHNGPYLTNMKQIDIGTAEGMDKGRGIDVPTLREVWRTGPYTHDGRFANIRDAIAICNRAADGNGGKVYQLSDKEWAYLLEYVKSL
jgi:DNA-binding beta-propeller fold protein YncE/cytochrome c peroxidase